MKKVALFLNHYKFGGAEKSALEQAQLLRNCKIDLFYPRYKKEELKLDDKPKKFINYMYAIEIHRALLEVSRLNLWSKFKGAFYYLSSFRNLYNLDVSQYDILWLNGMKIFVYLLPSLLLKRYPGRVYFHLRDYIPESKAIRFSLQLSRLFHLDLHFVANSHSVKRQFRKTYHISQQKISTCYNPCEASSENKNHGGAISTLGVCSMLSPWKGIHVVVLFANLYERELKELGVNSIKIFGSNIYASLGEHQNYENSLKALNDKLGGTLVSFEGLRSSKEMYDEIDVLIHSSLTKEPFGRVIIEAYGRGIPVISTGLGGASEILLEGDELLYQKHNYSGLFQAVRKLTLDQEYFNSVVSRGKVRASDINQLATEQIRSVFEG